MAYKENTNSTKNSPAINLLKKIKDKKVFVYDPEVKLGNKINNCIQLDNIKSLIKNSNVIIIMTPWNEFYKVEKEIKFKKERKIILIDPYRIVDSRIGKKKHLKYFTIGS